MEAGLVSMYSKHLEASQLVPAMPDSLSAHRRSPANVISKPFACPYFYLYSTYLSVDTTNIVDKLTDAACTGPLPVNTGLAAQAGQHTSLQSTINPLTQYSSAKPKSPRPPKTDLPSIAASVAFRWPTRWAAQTRKS